MPDAQRILIVRPSALGDVARTVPVLVSLRAAYPDATIDWLVNDTFLDAIAHHPALNEAIAFPRKRFARFGRSVSITKQTLAFFRALRARRYDAVYDMQGLGRSGWMTWVTGARLRVGAADAREMAWLGYTKKIRVPEDVPHTVDRMMHVLQAAGIAPVRDMRLYIGDADRAWMRQQMDAAGLEGKKLAVLAPTAAWLSKCWPIERYAEILGHLAAVGMQAVAVVGGPADRERLGPLLRATGTLPMLDLVGRTTVGQLMACIESADLLVANDSASLHLGIGLGRRCVGLFGPTDPEKVGPYRYDVGTVRAKSEVKVNYRALKTDQSTIGSIPVREVEKAIESVLRQPPPAVVHEARPTVSA